MFKIARVQDIILDGSHPRYNGESSIGSILFTLIDEPPPKNIIEDCSKAKPLNINIAHYPVPNEIVFLLPGPHEEYNENNRLIDYYLYPHSVFKDPNLNALPNALKGDTDFYKGIYFQETEYIRPLKPYEGDVIIEGRYGSSIRFGSTTPYDIDKVPPWNTTIPQEIGTPITIIRNGQRPQGNEMNFDHIVEDINQDASSIYLTSNQNMRDFIPASIYNNSYNTDINSKKHDEPELSDNDLSENISEDVMLNPSANLPPKDLQLTDEFSTFSDTKTSYYDISPTEAQAIGPTQTLTLPPCYNVPDNDTTENYLLENIE